MLLFPLTANPPCDVQTRANALEEHFGELVKCAYKAMSNKKVDDVKIYLFNLPVRKKKQHEDFLKENWSAIGSASGMMDIWLKLSSYWDFLNYSLLEYLVEKFCDNDCTLTAMMEDYKCKVKEFRCHTLLCDFINHFQDVNESLLEMNMEKLEVKLNKRFEVCTLEDLEICKKNITQKLLLPSFVVKLHRIRPGCISITWAIPNVYAVSLREGTKPVDMREFCEKHDIMSVKLEGKSLLPGQYCLLNHANM